MHRSELWAGATATVSVATKWGRSRPLRCITRVQTACRVTRNLDAPNNFASPLGDANGDAEGYVCLSRTRHLLAPAKAIETFPPNYRKKRVHLAYGRYQRELPPYT